MWKSRKYSKTDSNIRRSHIRLPDLVQCRRSSLAVRLLPLAGDRNDAGTAAVRLFQRTPCQADYIHSAKDRLWQTLTGMPELYQKETDLLGLRIEIVMAAERRSTALCLWERPLYNSRAIKPTWFHQHLERRSREIRGERCVLGPMDSSSCNITREMQDRPSYSFHLTNYRILALKYHDEKLYNSFWLPMQSKASIARLDPFLATNSASQFDFSCRSALCSISSYLENA